MNINSLNIVQKLYAEFFFIIELNDFLSFFFKSEYLRGKIKMTTISTSNVNFRKLTHFHTRFCLFYFFF